MAKADCHVHSEYSKYIEGTLDILTWLGAKECFSSLDDIYQIAKARGMDYVVITDHDTIEGAQILHDKHPEDVIIGEEVEVVTSHGGRAHLVVLDIDEEIHRDLSDLKKIGMKETTDYLIERDILKAIAHVSTIPSDIQPTPEVIHEMMDYVDILEVGNSLALIEENSLTSIITAFYKKKKIAGSDSHFLDTVGTAFTETKKPVKTKEEFIQALKHGDCYINDHEGCDTKGLTKIAVDYTKEIYKEILFHPIQRSRPISRKYFLDYLKLALLAPFAATRFTIYLYSWNYQRKTRKQVLKLTKDFWNFVGRERLII